MSALVVANNLSLSIVDKPILRSVSFEIEAGRVLGLVGESGCGKSLTALSLMGLLPPGSELSGSLSFAGDELVGLDETRYCALRGRCLSMAFQEPMTALNPLKTIGAQVAEVFTQHGVANKQEALEKAADVLERVELPNNEFPLSRYPFELSGGQRQRVVIAMAVALKPALLIADEPTTALDVTTEAKVLDLLKRLCVEDDIALLFVSHDLAAVARLADHIAIMKAGEIVEQGPTETLFETMQHPYSLALREASNLRRHRAANDAAPAAEQPLLEARELVRDYVLPRKRFFREPERFRAVDAVSFALYRGQNLGVVGESGSGKSTLVRAILGLDPLQGGSILIDGEPFGPGVDTPALRRKIQAVFQDPYGSFNPRHRIERIVAEPLHLADTRLTVAERRERVARALENVGLDADTLNKYPHQFSGGQRQRIAIARALVVSPSIIVLDEATSALDVSIRGQILELLATLSQKLGVSYVFVSHDIDVVRTVTDRVLVMKAGRVVEQGPTQQVFATPEHPYTRALLAAKLTLEEELRRKGAHAS